MKNRDILPGRARPLIFGHRGFSEEAPENTMEAFSLCVERGVPGVELDVHICASGELVITHDFSVKRVTGFDGIVEQMNYEQLRALDAGSFKAPTFKEAYIPLMEELFDTFGDSLYYDIELKQSGFKDLGLASSLFDLIRSYAMEDHCVVSSFNPFAVRSFRRVSGNRIPTAVIYCIDDQVPKLLQHGKGRYIAGCGFLKPHYSLIKERTFSIDHERRGYPMFAWTVNSEVEANRLIDLGVDGMIGNDPGMLKALL